ncbi:general secretion pathway protein GspI [Blastochloris sulfoviridis]|uniref:General secretion pathway protein GspI n=1 Tax=Blastochloris sulfoviridis TaxID=50712 RepID=A0A5M6I796_9HYPH|nr:general secretion pathway protein GspI [Blastochloris sulfoviridis]KAA5603688.1 general secretion pathway protein GspI [Blastochloris sulfoviridis]
MIEAVAALALVTVSLAAIGSLVASAATSTRTLEQHVALVETARLVAATALGRADLARSDLGGEVGRYRWRIDTSPYFGGGSQHVANSPWAPQRVVLRVRAPSGAVLAVETVRLVARPGQ